MEARRSSGWQQWWSFLKSVAYELRPCPMPRVRHLKEAAAFLRKNAAMLVEEAGVLAPEVIRVASEVKATTVLAATGWLSGWLLFVRLEFGLVYVIVSGFGLVLYNLGDGKDGMSAYSVFNAGCRAILGTLSAEQLEREIMRHNPARPDLPGGGDDDDDLDDDDDQYVFVDGDGAEVAGDGGGGGGGGGGMRRLAGKRRRALERRQRRQQQEAPTAAAAAAGAAAGVGAGDEG